MKKIVLVLASIFLATGLFAQTIKSKEGYKTVKWGASKDAVKNAGYRLVNIGEKDRQALKEEYLGGTEAYYVATSEKMVTSLIFYFYDGKLFQVVETIPEKNFSESKLKSRYGSNLTKNETTMGDIYADFVMKADAFVDGSISVMHYDGNYLTTLFDFSVYSKVSKSFMGMTVSDNLVGELKNLAEKLVQNSSTKPTYAFVALSSDDGNALLENYVTDALTEAMFNTGKIKIVERASIEKIMAEQKFQSSALVNENTAVEIGNLSGANYVCYGTVKDIGRDLSFNVKVVEVSTAELCAMGRETVSKDRYLTGIGFEKRGSGNSGTASSSTKSTAKKVSNNQWRVQKVRNDFDECTVYTFTVTTPEKYMILVGLKKYDNPMYSSAWCGFVGLYGFDSEIKGSSGIVKKYLRGRYWNLNGHDANYYSALSSGDKGTKWLFDMCLESEVVTVRDSKSNIGRFQTAGLEEKIIEAGLTVDDFLKAYSNEDF